MTHTHITHSEPLHTALINCHPVRFFHAPNAVTALPWHVLADLTAATGMPAYAQSVFLTMTRKGPFQDDIRTIMTGLGSILIGPHWIAQGTIGALIQAGFVSSDFEEAYYQALVAACAELHKDLPASKRWESLIAMGRHHLGSDDPLRAASNGQGDAK